MNLFRLKMYGPLFGIYECIWDQAKTQSFLWHFGYVYVIFMAYRESITCNTWLNQIKMEQGHKWEIEEEYRKFDVTEQIVPRLGFIVARCKNVEFTKLIEIFVAWWTTKRATMVRWICCHVRLMKKSCHERSQNVAQWWTFLKP